MDQFTGTLVFLVIGMLLLGIGTSKHNSRFGLTLVFVGALCMLTVIFYNILTAISV